MQAELVLDARNAVGECPVWVPAEQALYWVDIEARAIWRWRDGDALQWAVDQQVACIAPRARGGWIAAMETGVYTVELGQPAQLLHEAAHPRPGMRFNDGRCDRQGRMRAGTMLADMAGAQAVGTLYAIDGGLTPLVHELITPNGLAFSPDGRTMYLSDSHPRVQQVWAFDYDTDTGRPHNRRLFVDMKALPGRPDGAAVDVDGCYWNCANDAGLVHRFTPRGELDRSIALPVKKPSMCAFGGPQLDTLYVTSIRPKGIDLTDQPLAGGLFALRPGVGGLADPPCIA
ncbi:MAG: SMP-30/gluconolactonase/LRE family protein [Burkholderiales bacterium]|nr:SMP-30/gluconolactonase/LRE family protein [Burkholderiales bacterium]